MTTEATMFAGALPELRGRRVTVMGLGQFGGGVGVTKYLVSRGARVTLTAPHSSPQSRPPPQLALTPAR